MPGDVWVFAEQEEGVLGEVALELLSKGRELADQLGSKLISSLLGYRVKNLAKDLIAHGSDSVVVVDDPSLEVYTTLPYAQAVIQLVERYRPEILLFGATPLGRDMAPRIASYLRAGLTADCTDLLIRDHEERFRGKFYKNVLHQVRPAFGGNIIATIVTPEHRPQMATVREGVMRIGRPDYSRTGEVIQEHVELSPTDRVVRVVGKVRAEKKVDLKSAQVIVSGGYGMGGRENFGLIWEMARALGGEVGASRAAVDAGFAEGDHQVGQTGTTVRPKLYIACGISGAIQHRAGMQESHKIIAINRDPNAPIFEVAHYKIVGDVNEVIPKMIKALRER